MDSGSNISLERGFDMSDILIPLTVLLPIIGGVLIPVLPFKKLKLMHIYTECVVIITSILVAYLLFNKMGVTYDLVRFSGDLSLSLRLDGLGSVFCAMVAFLWPFVTLYAFEYMKHEGKEHSFFMFFTMTYGVTLGIASSANLVTMYCFYEMLTLVTLPLVMHSGSREAVLASRKYLYYSLGGAAFAFIGLIFMISYGSTDFAYGGTLNLGLIGNRENILKLVYVMAFMGFGVKAALFPFSEWLPQAGVALGMSLTAMSLGEPGVVIRSVALFAVLVYELVGPLLTRIALEKAGEITEKPIPARMQAKLDAKK